MSKMASGAAKASSFSDRLTAKVRERRNAVLVGLDPRWEQLPASLRGNVMHADRATQAAAYETFCKEIIDVVATLVPAAKPQAAFFEQLGAPGMAALERVVRYAREKGLLVILDGKRNDIGSTATAYAEGYLGDEANSAWAADALTVSPYLGDDSLTPFVDVCTERGAGIFVLVKTSNPGGKMLQDMVSDGQPIYRHVAAHVERLAAHTKADCGYGAVGAVVGATYPEQLIELRSAMPHTWFLVPGFGAQGGAAADVAPAFDARGLGAVINNSRGLIFAHARKEFAQFGEKAWQGAVEAATKQMIEELRAVATYGMP